MSTPGALRRGLPRTVGGDPWPTALGGAELRVADTPAPELPSAAAHAPEQSAAPAPLVPARPPSGPIRRGLPRAVGGDAWPPVVVAAPVSQHMVAEEAAPVIPAPSADVVIEAPAPAPPAVAETRRPRLSRRSRIVLGSIGIVVAAGIVVLSARGLTTYAIVQDFLAAYPGEYELPAAAPIGFSTWVGWQHFLNAFFIVLIIRTGWRVRTESRPPAYWTARWSRSPRKISLTLWMHQALDVLWLLNGVTFVVLLFASGRWMRIVPTSWEVFPNALSALLQYLTLDWPTENGWVNYNSLQQVTYFITVFIAAPLAAATGVRISGVWPQRAKRLSELYPVSLARAVHFPVMLYFVAFVIFHVFLVLATGALRNLNHIYAASDDVNPVGFIIFAVSVLVMAGAWFTVRPLFIAPIAQVVGTVSSR